MLPTDGALCGGDQPIEPWTDVEGQPLRDAEEIGAYVSAVRERQAALDDPLSAAGLQQWADWALSQADRIEPVLSGSFRTVQDDD